MTPLRWPWRKSIAQIVRGHPELLSQIFGSRDFVITDTATDLCYVSTSALTLTVVHDWREQWVTTSFQFAGWEDSVPDHSLLRYSGAPEVEPIRGSMSDAQVAQALMTATLIVEKLNWDQATLDNAIRAFHHECEEYTQSASLSDSTD